MLVTVAVLPFLLLSIAQTPTCPDVGACRQAALDAAARGDFETFHDLAWRAAQKGRPNDPELMYLLARAQSLSGRPGDALVMLRRLAQLGVQVVIEDYVHQPALRVAALVANTLIMIALALACIVAVVIVAAGS